uniref:Uncharacterized protein n=1 Tax=Avena sativa TaxID=4498 RepID=A0ACD5X9V5_AVESA
MANAVTAGAAAALLPGLPDEIVIWEVLVLLPPKSLLRCRAVCRAWRRTTSAPGFLLAHHGRQPSLPIVCEFKKSDGYYKDILTFDHRAAPAAARLQHFAQLDNDNSDFFSLQASCDGLLIISASTTTYRPCLSVCNPATRQRALLRQPRDASLFSVLGMYLHRPSGEYRLLLYRTCNWLSIDRHDLLAERRIGCYISALGSDQAPRYIGGPEAVSAVAFHTPALVRDCLHWPPVQKHQGKNGLVIVFDTTVELFRQIHAPIVSAKSYIFEMDGKLGIYSYDDAMKIVDIWMLADYEGEIWEHKCRVELPVAEIRGLFGRREGQWEVSVVSTDGVILLLLSLGKWLFHVDIGGQLVDSFHRDCKKISACGFQLKHTLVPHTFFTALEEYAVNAAPFI